MTSGTVLDSSLISEQRASTGVRSDSTLRMYLIACVAVALTFESAESLICTLSVSSGSTCTAESYADALCSLAAGADSAASAAARDSTAPSTDFAGELLLTGPGT